jgi:hypothetical protein
MLPPLEQSLLRRNVDELKWYAVLLPGKAPTRKGELVAMIVQALTDPEQVTRLWSALTPRQREMIAYVVYHGLGVYDADVIEARYPGVGSPTGPQLYANSFMGHRKKDAVAFDLFFFYDHEVGFHVPREMAALIRDLSAPPPPQAIASHENPPQVATTRGRMERNVEVMIAETERGVFHDLAATISVINDGKISVSPSTRLPTLTSVRYLAKRLLLADYFSDIDYERAEDAMRPLALVLLAQVAGWASPIGTKGNKLELTRSGLALLGRPIQAEHVRNAWERWLKSDLLDELSRIRAIKGQQSKAARLTKPTHRREKLTLVLKDCPVGRWVAFDEFLRYMRAEGQLPEIEHNIPTALYVGPDFEYGWLGYLGVQYWDVVTGSYMRAALWEYAATLGIVDIAYTRPEESPHDFGDVYGLDEYDYISRYDGLLGLRLTPLGAYALGLMESHDAATPAIEAGPPALKVLPNLDVVITDQSRLALNERTFLARIAAPTSESVYHLDREKMLDAIQEGLTLIQAQEFLANRSGTSPDEFPQTVRVFFSDLEKRLNAVREAGRMLVLEGDDPLVLTELAHSRQIRSLVQLARTGERTVLLVLEENEKQVRKHLKKLGYVPSKPQSGAT